jgi:GntR family transcriptional regulator/MocR family aminotransferase
MRDQTNHKISLDQSGEIPLGRQLYTELYRRIMSGELTEGTRLPPSRELAISLGVARATVTSIYEQLRKEGYLVGDGRRGTVVSRSAGSVAAFKKAVRGFPALSEFGQFVLSAPEFDPSTPQAKFPLYGWMMSQEDLPARQLQTAFSRIMHERPRHVFEYPRDPHGLKELREAIAGYLHSNKAITVSPDQVMIVSGWQQALDLIVRLNVPRGAQVIMESPGYPTVMQAFIAGGANVLPIDVDSHGLQVEQLAGVRACAAHVTPSHHFPTGSILSIQRRIELLTWSTEQNAILIEEEHDSDFRYSGHPVPSLKALDLYGNVIYLANFTKTLFPGLSLGYMLIPAQLTELYRKAKAITQESVSLPVQQIIADFITSGEYERHVKRLRATYSERRIALMNAFEKHLGNQVEVFGDSAGKHVLVRFRSRLTTKRIIDAALEVGVGLQSSKQYYLSGTAPEREFIVGYGGLTPKQIDMAISRLAKVLKV